MNVTKRIGNSWIITETKNEDETEERRVESRLRIETIRQEREEEEEMIRATLLTSRSLFPRKLKKK